MAEFIERGKALSMRFTDGIREDGLIYVPLRDVTQHLKTLPSADVRENIHARWKCTALGNYACSYCCKEPYYSGNIEDYPFCPYCGADMRRADND